MVSISRKRIKRQRPHDRRTSQRLGAYALAAAGSLLFVYAAVAGLAGSGGAGAGDGLIGGGSGGGYGPFRRARSRRNHPDLHVGNDLNGESYNALALDILQTLDCVRLLNETTSPVGPAGGAAAGYRPPPSPPRDRRRLQEGGSGAELDDLVRPGRQMPDGANVQEINPLPPVGEDKDLPFDVRNVRDIAMDDFREGGGADWDYTFDVTPTAAHLFCMAAMAGNRPDDDAPTIPPYWTTAVHCPVAKDSATTGGGGNRLQLQLLQLWSKARADMPLDILLQVLKLATEHQRVLLDSALYLWAPTDDTGLEYMLNVLNDPNKTADDGGIRGLGGSLGRGKLFVDVGSCIGATSLAVQLLYPGTRAVSVEAASPSWLLQQLNWKCNQAPLRDAAAADGVAVAPDGAIEPTIILGGVGPETGGMAKVMWRPQATTSTRSWTPASERLASDIELMVKLRPWHDILAEAEIQRQTVDVLNVDCEGCEYNLIPAFTDDEYNAISTVLGGVHWGYMPEHKLPSSKRGALTHERLCRHENFARTVKECCAFPDLAVISSVPGEVLVQDSKAWPPKPSTVKDVAGSLCDGFDRWAKEHHLYDIESDWGWFQITSMAD